MLAEAYRHAGQIEKGLETLAEGIAIQAKKGPPSGAAELCRPKGELTLQKFKVQGSEFNGEEKAEECFQKALSIARAYEAKSWELRAAISLAQQWQQQGKMPEAYDLLSGVYAWFTEGFETADLQDAKAVLEQLQGRRCLDSKCMQIADLHSLRDVQVLNLTTAGRRSCTQRDVELWFIVHCNRFYVMAEHGHQTGWVKNLRKHPEAAVALADYQIPVWAWILDQERDRREWRVVAELFRKKYGWGDGLPVALEPPEAHEGIS